MAETAQLLGFQRAGSKLDSAISSAVNALATAGELRVGALGVELVRGHGAQEEGDDATPFAGATRSAREVGSLT